VVIRRSQAAALRPGAVKAVDTGPDDVPFPGEAVREFLGERGLTGRVRAVHGHAQGLTRPSLHCQSGQPLEKNVTWCTAGHGGSALEIGQDGEKAAAALRRLGDAELGDPRMGSSRPG
jgi:hypothetical protein